jgi:hypothetical protein
LIRHRGANRGACARRDRSGGIAGIAEPVENNLKQEAPPPEEPAERRDLLTKGLTEFREERIDQPKGREK